MNSAFPNTPASSWGPQRKDKTMRTRLKGGAKSWPEVCRMAFGLLPFFDLIEVEAASHLLYVASDEQVTLVGTEAVVAIFEHQGIKADGYSQDDIKKIRWSDSVGAVMTLTILRTGDDANPQSIPTIWYKLEYVGGEREEGELLVRWLLNVDQASVRIDELNSSAIQRFAVSHHLAGDRRFAPRSDAEAILASLLQPVMA